MSQYGEKLKELRMQTERQEYLAGLLSQLNEEKAAVEYELVPLENEMNKALKNLQRAEKGGILNMLGGKSDRVETAQLRFSAAKVKYETAARQLESIQYEIQKAFNESANLSDAKRKYKNLMDEIDKALAEGKTHIITQAELDREYAALQKNRKEKLELAVDAGNSLLDYLGSILDGQLPYNRPQDIKKELYKFRLAVNNVDISNNIAIDFTSYRHFYSKVGYPGSYLNNIDGHLPIVRYDFPLTQKEMLAEVALTAQNTAVTVEMLKQQLEQLS